MSRAVVITAEEEKSLQKLDDRRSAISSLIARTDSNSSATKTLHAKNEEIIEAKFAELIKQIEERKKTLLASVSTAQQDKQALIDKNVITLKKYLVNIENINNNYNQWLIRNKMNRHERKDKLAKIVDEECDKLLPQISDVQIAYNHRLVPAFLDQICQITNIGLFYPEITDFEVTKIGHKSVTVKWRAKLRKDHLIYVEQDNLDMSHIMMSLQIQRLKKEEVKDEHDDEDDDEEEKQKDEEENIDEMDKELIHCIDYELDEEEYGYKFTGLRGKSSYVITLKCISIMKDLLITEHHRQDLNSFKPLTLEIALAKHEPFLFKQNSTRIAISNDGQTVSYAENSQSHRKVCVQLGGYIDTEDSVRKFKVTLSLDRHVDHVGFGFIAPEFDNWEHDDWGFGDKCTFYYSDNDFYGSNEFHNNNPNRLELSQCSKIYVQVDCETLIGRLWGDGQDTQFCETTLPKQFALAVSLGRKVGSTISVVTHQEPYP